MLQVSYQPYIFKFKVPSGTSRGILTKKPSWFIKVWNAQNPDIIGTGEVSIIPGLSRETPVEIEKRLNALLLAPQLFADTLNESFTGFPAVRFGFETALIDLASGGKQELFPSEFTRGEKGIKINGLIWMGQKKQMLEQITEKIEQGFTCIKIKVGAIDFDEELSLLKAIRNEFAPETLKIRLDANGAFSTTHALEKLRMLSKHQIHSIEQPIKQGQYEAMSHLCRTTPIPIALDEELMGIEHYRLKVEMVEYIRPQYIILKPSLIGGLDQTKIWTQIADERKIGWWVTSALEGNIGLNAIAQWTFLNGSNMPQGLGTGQVFANNLHSPLEIRGEELWYNTNFTMDS
jgi:O-succinylbenzoate synthase